MMRFLAWVDRHAGVILAILLALCALLLLQGCGRTQVQDLADAKAGAVAYQQEADPVRRALIANGIVGHLLAGLEDYPLLPRPSATPPEIRADPAAYAAAGAAAQADPQPYVAEHHQAPKPKPPGILERLRAWAGTLLDTGLMIGGICAILVAVFWLADWLRWMPTGIIGAVWRVAAAICPPLARIGTLWGAASASLGAALTWLTDWWWAVLLVALVVAGVVAWVHWRDIRSWLAARRLSGDKPPSRPDAAVR